MLLNFLRNELEESVASELCTYALGLEDRGSIENELRELLGVKGDGSASLEEARKLDFIDEFIYKKFGGKKKPKKHQVKLQVGKDTMN
jgi:hypothetical protein